MLGIAWAALCGAAAFGWHRRLEWLVVAALVLWVAMPGIARAPFAIGPLDLHPAAMLVLATLAVQLVRQPRRIVRVIETAPAILVVLTAVALLAAVETLALSRGPEGVMAAVEQIWCAVALFVLVGAALLERPAFAGRLAGWLAGVVALEGGLAVVQAMLHRPLLWTRAYEAEYWFTPQFDRWMGTADHPLVLTLLVLLAAPLLVRRMGWGWRLLALAGMTAAMASAQSRVGIILFALEVVFVLARARAGRGGRALMGLVVLASLAVAWTMGAFDAVILRLTTDDGGSAEARTLAFGYFTSHLSEWAWLGLGMNQNILLSKAAGLGTSFENSFVMTTIDLGLPVALVYYGAMLACIALGLVHRPGRAAALAALVGFGYVQTFSALGTRCSASAWLWALLALALFSREAAARESAADPGATALDAPQAAA